MAAEWENWVLSENRRCRQVGALLEEQSRKYETEERTARKGLKGKVQRLLKKAAGDGSVKDAPGKLLGDDVYHWYENYCGSCRREQELLEARGPGGL
jgi:hypothetical protein